MQVRKGQYRLAVPIDASAVPDAEGAVRVAVVDARGGRQSQVVKLGKGRGATADFTFAEQPRGLRVLVGPESASEEDLERRQTLSATVPARSFRAANDVTINPLTILPHHWTIWPLWCRKFKVTGYVRCPDGSPVPGATVCVSDVDFFLFWTGKQQLGCTMTDQNGYFELNFKFCCEWQPWWWWHLIQWELNPVLATSIIDALPPERRVAPLPLPGPKPDLDFIAALLPEAEPGAAPSIARSSTSKGSFDFARAEALRKDLVKILPPVTPLPIWPWKPWFPWLSCYPDLVFRVTQECNGQVNVIVEEDLSDVHWNAPTNYSVNLVANNLACCVPDEPDCDAGNCLVLTHACNIYRDAIGGNAGAAAAPAGYAYPATGATDSDRPFAGVVPIIGTATCMDSVDYYRFLYTGPGVATPTPLPLASMGGFSRMYFVTSPSFAIHSEGFSPVLVDGKYVFKTLKRWEDENPGVNPHWYVNRDLLVNWLTSSSFPDGLYTLQVEAFTEAGGVLTAQTLDSCEGGGPSILQIRLDNRVVPDPTHSGGHPCGSGTVHTCTNQPESIIESVSIIRNSVAIPIQACTKVDLQTNDALEITFVAWDPDGHLGSFTLDATYGVNQISHLLALGTLTTASGSIAGISPAAQVGPTYAAALTQLAASPTWNGGGMKLTIPWGQICNAFPYDCCYQLELRVYKRTIVDCYHGHAHNNLSEYSFFLGTTAICPP